MQSLVVSTSTTIKCCNLFSPTCVPHVIARNIVAKQSIYYLDCRAALAMTATAVKLTFYRTINAQRHHHDPCTHHHSSELLN